MIDRGFAPRARRWARDVGLVGIGLSVGLVMARSRAGLSRRELADQADRPENSGHGRDAMAPTDLPAAGWVEIAKRTFHEISRDRVLAVAAGVTFYGLLAIFPALAALVSIYGLAASPASIGDHLGMLAGILPAGAVELIQERALSLASRDAPGLGLSLVLGLAVSIWSANAGMKAIFDALNVAYGEDEKRSFIVLNLTSLAFTAGALIFAIMAIGAVVAVPILLDMVRLGEAAETIMSIGRWPVLIAVLLVGLALLYRFGPSREVAQWSWVSPGALLAAFLWITGSFAFSWYVANFEDYDQTYGAVGAAIGLMMWLWLTSTILLVGAEFNAESERQTHEDTTTGPPLPMGSRGADVADRKP